MTKNCKIIFISFCLIVLGASAASCQGNVTVLIYHKFGEPKYPTTNVSIAKFAAQMAYLHDENYQVLSVAKLVALRTAKTPLPDRAVVITIDDGYESVYSGAWPILQQYNYPFTVFLYGKAIEGKYHDFLNWKQIAEMRRAGVDFQDHSYSHYRMGSKPEAMSDDDYGQWIRHDLEKSRAGYKRHFGVMPDFLALPYGEYNTIVTEQAKEIGYKNIFSQDPGSVSSDTGFIIPREPILGYEWSTLAHFKGVLEREDLPVSDILPDTSPFNGNAKQFCATLLYPQRYDLRTLRIYVSELGWQTPSEVNGSRICLDNNRELKRRLNRVAISAEDKTTRRQAIHFWLLIR